MEMTQPSRRAYLLESSPDSQALQGSTEFSASKAMLALYLSGFSMLERCSKAKAGGVLGPAAAYPDSKQTYARTNTSMAVHVRTWSARWQASPPMMSKKPKRSRHRVPTLAMASDEVTTEYQGEVDASMERLRRRYEKAQKALAQSEEKAERARRQSERLALKQVEVARVNAQRHAEEARLGEYIERIKEAAKAARVAAAQIELNRKRDDAIRRRNALTELRRAEAKAMRQREVEIGKAKVAVHIHSDQAQERRRELQEIERLMMPGNYAGRNHRGNGQARHNSGGGV